MSKKRLGFARVEFIACKPEIDKLLAAGYTIIGAHEVLREQGKISMGYGRFTQLLRKGVKRSIPISQRSEATKEPAPVQQPPQVPPKSVQEDKILGVVEKGCFKKSSEQTEDEDLF